MTADPSRAFAAPKLTDAKGNPHPAVGAIKALAKGTARPDQQMTAMNFILEDVCRSFDLSFQPDDAGGERDTAFAEGRRFVGLQLRRIIMRPLEELTGKRQRAAKEQD